MPSIIADLPLFPLHTVLFPGGMLFLKIFELRYLDMARACLRDQTPFGVCLLKSGSEIAQSNAAPVFEPIGCMAKIDHCDVHQFGLLHIRAQGTSRFRLLSSRTESNGLLCGMAQPIADDLPVEGTAHLAKLAACAEVAERIISMLKARDPNYLPFFEPFQFDNSSWISNRLAEVLPIPLDVRQYLMELDDATMRLDIVHYYMQQYQLL